MNTSRSSNRLRLYNEIYAGTYVHIESYLNSLISFFKISIDFFREYFLLTLVLSDLNCTVWNSVSYCMTNVCLSLIWFLVSFNSASFSRSLVFRASIVNSSTAISLGFSLTPLNSNKFVSNLKMMGLGGDVLFRSINSEYSSEDLIALTLFSILLWDSWHFALDRFVHLDTS